MKAFFFVIAVICHSQILAQSPLGAVTGKVVDVFGKPVAGAAVYFNGNPLTEICYTDSSGTFTSILENYGQHTLLVQKFSWAGLSLKVTINSPLVNCGTIQIAFGDIDNSKTVDLQDLSYLEDVVEDSVSNFSRYLDFDGNGIVDSIEFDEIGHGIETIGMQCPEWLVSQPDFVTYVPALSNPQFATNQHYLMIQLSSGRLFGIWTAANQEGSPNQSMVYHYSDDLGRSWSDYKIIDGPQSEGRISSWGFPIYVPELDRIYVFYNKDAGSRIYHQGELWMKYTEDGGATWSDIFKYKFDRGEYSPQDTTKAPYWWAYQIPLRIGDKYLIGFTEILPHEPDVFYSTEIRFLSFENIISETDPKKLSISTYPSGGKPGIRGSFVYQTNRSMLQEPSIVQLSDGRLFCVMRSVNAGTAYYSLSSDSGKTWSSARVLKYGDGLRNILQPMASCPIFKIGDSSYVFIFHNNNGTGNGGIYPTDWQFNRSPAFISYVRERLESTQPLIFDPPIRVFENYLRPTGSQSRTEIATYPSLTNINGKNILWYPDRKYYLLGKILPAPAKSNSP